MKKKFISFLMAFCMVFPCFFIVACNSKDKENNPTKAYTYSVVLKNAKGKIDENVLGNEYDYKKQEYIDWTNAGNDYSLSVTRKNVLSGDLVVGLLEGYDYSNIDLKVNNKATAGNVRSGEKIDCETSYHLADREFCYSYQKMKSNTEIIIDFSECVLGKVEIDIKDLIGRSIAAYKVTEDFATINTIKESSTEVLNEESVIVDYGTILAFSCAEKLVYKSEVETSNYQSLSYAQYASKFYTFDDQNVVQYLKAQQSGICTFYSAEKDALKNDTLRIVGVSDINVYTSLENLEEGIKATLSTEYEIYNEVSIKANIIKSSNIFVKLDSEAQKYSYHLLSSIDEKLSNSNYIEPKLIESTETKYLEIDISEENDESNPAKYLVRKPLQTSNYYIICPKGLGENAIINNADYILFGKSNKQDSAYPQSYNGNIFFGFEKTKDVELDISETTKDKTTGFDLKNNSAIANIRLYDRNGAMFGTPLKTFGTTTFDNALSISCFEDGDYGFYELTVDFDKENFSNERVELDVSNLNLFENEKIYLSSDLADPESWSEVTASSNLAIRSEKSGTKFYYIDSDRTDAILEIKDSSGEVVSLTGRLTDCYGRLMSGTVDVDGKTIDLSKIYYLDIIPGYYEEYAAKLTRGFDKTVHNIDISGIKDSVTMISIGGYSADGSSFKHHTMVGGLEIKYENYSENEEIYYYISSYTNEYLQLRNSAGDVVSENILVLDENNEPLKINGAFVYELKLVGGYYESEETFTAEVLNSTYSLVDELGNSFEIFATENILDEPEQTMTLNQTYYFVGEIDKDYIIVEYESGIIVNTFTEVESIDAQTSIFSFKLTFPSGANYVNGTTFKIVATEK